MAIIQRASDVTIATEIDSNDHLLMEVDGATRRVALSTLTPGAAVGNYGSRAAFVSAVAAGLSVGSGTVVTAGGMEYVYDGLSTIADLPGWAPRGPMYPDHFGAVGDGVTSDLAALRAWALASANKELRLRAEANYLGTLSSTSDKLSFQAGCTLRGPGTITLANTSAIYMEFVSVQKSNITIDGVDFVGNIFAGTTGFFFILGNNTTPTENVLFANGSVDLQNSISGGTGVHSVHGFSFNSSFDGHTWRNWTFTRCNYATIKTNTATGDQNRVRFDGCLFKNNVRGNLTGFNSPSGGLTQVVVTGCHFVRELAYFIDIQDQTLMGGCVHVQGCTFSDNTAYGYGRDVIHFEEMTGPTTVANNSWVHQGGGEDGGITFRSNNIGGTLLTTRNISIVGNSGKVEGAAASGSVGIWFVWDGDGEPGGENVTVSGNVMTGYETGINVGDAILADVTGNTLTATVGITTLTPTTSIHGNTIIGATSGLTFQSNGIFGRNTFINCADILVPASTETRCMMVGFDVVLTEQSLPNGSTNLPFDIATIPTEMTGWLDYVMRHSDINRANYSASISSTGSTLGAVTRRLRVSVGNPTISTTDANIITNNAGALAVTATNSSGSNVTITIHASFTGSWMQ